MNPIAAKYQSFSWAFFFVEASTGAMLRGSVLCMQCAAMVPDVTHLQAVVQPDIWLKPTNSPLRRPSVLFRRDISLPPSYPGCIRAPNVGLAAPLFKVTSPSCDYYAVRLPLLKAGFKRIADIHSPLPCNLQWGKSIPMYSSSMLREQHLAHLRPSQRFQRINHFVGGHTCIGCKQGLAGHLNTFFSRFGAEFGTITPKTWCVPSQREQFLDEALSAQSHGKNFILKPARGSCGRGIQILTAAELDSLDEIIQQWRPGCGSVPFVIQEYIDNPMLVNGRKFDLRLYAVVTSIDPLVIYLHDQGLVRFAAKQYMHEVTKDTFSHLTNYSIGRKLEKPAAEDTEPQLLDLKWSLGRLLQVLRDEKGVDVPTLWKKIEEIVIISLISVQWDLRKLERRQPLIVQDSSFEVYGVDILIDDTHNPWLVEFNTLPSFEASSSLDYNVKSDVMTDLLNVLQLELFERSEEGFAASGFDVPARCDPRCLHLFHPHEACLNPAQGNNTLFARLDDEVRYAGGFQRIFPSLEYLRKFQHAIDYPTEAMMQYWAHIRDGETRAPGTISAHI